MLYCYVKEMGKKDYLKFYASATHQKEKVKMRENESEREWGENQPYASPTHQKPEPCFFTVVTLWTTNFIIIYTQEISSSAQVFTYYNNKNKRKKNTSSPNSAAFQHANQINTTNQNWTNQNQNKQKIKWKELFRCTKISNANLLWSMPAATKKNRVKYLTVFFHLRFFFDSKYYIHIQIFSQKQNQFLERTFIPFWTCFVSRTIGRIHFPPPPQRERE